MKTKLLLLLSFFVFSSCGLLPGDELGRDRLMWEKAYDGDFSLVHKLVIDRQNENMNDELLSHFAMVYVFYRSGQVAEMEAVLEGVDSYLERLISGEK